MKKVRLILVAVVAILFMGVGNVSAQESKSVLIKAELNGIDYNVTTIQSNYEINVIKDKREKTFTDTDFLLLVKKEIDKYLNQGYVLSESTVTPHYGDRTRYIIYVLTKKE